MIAGEEVVRTHEVRPRSGEKDAKIAVAIGGLILISTAAYFFLCADNHSDNQAATGVGEAAQAGLIGGPSAAPAR
jgi:hypothetical protein